MCFQGCVVESWAPSSLFRISVALLLCSPILATCLTLKEKDPFPVYNTDIGQGSRFSGIIHSSDDFILSALPVCSTDQAPTG